MQAYTYVEKGKFALLEKPKPVLLHERDAIVKVTLTSICSSDLHIKHGSVPRAVPGITVGHEMVGVVESVGSAVTHVKPGDRVTVNVETFCGECFFCKKGFVNNCTDENGGWALGCRIDGGQTEAARSLGLNQVQSMRFVVLPQAIKNVLPALANEVVTMVKESSICSVLGMAEIMYTAQTVSGNSYITLAPYVLAALVYFCINYPASKAIEAIERRMRRGDKQ